MTELTTAPHPLNWRSALASERLGPSGRRALTWGLAVLLSVYLGLSGGGYDIVVRSEVGLIVWWFVLLGALIGLLPRARVPRAGWIAGGLLGGFLIWTWIGLSWSSSHELTLANVCQLSTYLGVLVLGLCAVTSENARALINGLGCGIAAVSTLAVLSKLTPGLFPAESGKAFYETARLSYPFDYADGVGEYAALGLPLVLYMATSGRTLAGRATATGALQPILLCLAMTVSRGGILAAFLGIIAFFALVPNRIPRLPTLAVTAAGIAVLMISLLHRAALRDSTSVAPAHERHSMLAILCVVVAAVVVAQALVLLAMGRLTRPRWLHVSRRGAQGVTAATVLAVAAIVIVAFASGTTGHLWHDFKLWNPSAHSNQYFRLLSLAGSHRYQYWQIAWKAFTGSPLHGIGPGTFRLFWGQHTTSAHAEYIQNAHSLWFETLAETGIVGWLLIAGFFGFVIVTGIVRALGASESRRALIATATAGVIAFCAAAAFDWVWQIGVIPIVTMLLVSVVVLPGHEQAGQPVASGPRASWRLPNWIGPRLVLGIGSLVAMVLIAIPLASTVAVRASQSAYARGQLKTALADANTARAIEPSAVSPYVQRALLLEQMNDIAGANTAIRAAIARQPDDNTLWLLASRIATELNQPQQALADFRHAQKLYPTWTLLST